MDPLSDITKQTLSGDKRSTHVLTLLARVDTTSEQKNDICFRNIASYLINVSHKQHLSV